MLPFIASIISMHANAHTVLTTDCASNAVPCVGVLCADTLKAHKIIANAVAIQDQLTVRNTLDLRDVHTVVSPQPCTSVCQLTPNTTRAAAMWQKVTCANNPLRADLVKAQKICAGTEVVNERLIVNNVLDLSGVTTIIAPEQCFTCNDVPCINSNACLVFQELCQPVDPVNGCVASSQAVLDLRNLYANAILAISPQQSMVQFFSTGNAILPPSGDLAELAQWQRWTPQAVADQVSLSQATRNTLINVSFANMFEQERQELLSLGYDYTWWLADPRRMLHSAATVTGATNYSTAGIFAFFFNATGSNIFAASLGLDLTILSWNNYADSLIEYREYIENEGLNNTIVFSAIDLANIRQLYPQSIELGTPIVNTIAYAPFLAGTPEQQADAQLAFQRVRDATQPLIDFLEVGGAYDLAVQQIRDPLVAPGLSAPLMPDELKLVQYPFALNVIANTHLSPAEILALGMEQVTLLEEQIVEVVQTYIDGTVTDWPNFINRYRFDPVFRDQFVTHVTVSEYLSEQQTLVYQAWSNAIKAFQHFPHSPLDVRLFPGFSAPFYTPPVIQQDGTGTVTLANGFYNSPTLSNTVPIDLNEVITVDKSFDSSTVFHEGIPGHHLQIAMLSELACQLAVPFNSGATEGWAVYAEQVAANDMELAQPNVYPYRRLDYLTARLFRACRLVVDSSLHAFEMSRPEAVDFLFFNSVELEPFIESEVDRYITWPGQAVGYLVGALALERERAQAEAALGASFNLAQWHDVMIRYLAPVEQLITQLNDFYIERTLNGTFNEVWPPIVTQPRRSPLLNITTTTPFAALQRVSTMDHPVTRKLLTVP